MADIINFNKNKKVKALLKKEQKASENRIKFGRTKKEKQSEAHDKARHEKYLDGHKLEKKEEQ